ncbi:hypothetical protein PFISCL1PPCAC_12657, partial [Pristionchus fissidentatus]
NISWVGQYSRSVSVFGKEAGDCGEAESGKSKKTTTSICSHSLFFANIQRITARDKLFQRFESAQKRLCRTTRALLAELLVGGLFYILPSVIFTIFHLQPPRFLPDMVFTVSRVLFVLSFALQSTASALIFLSNHRYGRVRIYFIQSIN